MSNNFVMTNGGDAVITAPWNSSTVLLSHFEGVNGSTAPVDETGKAWTLGSSNSISTAQSKFGGSSLKFGNLSTSYASIPFPALGTGDWTVEMFIRFDGFASGNGNTIFDARPPNTNGPYLSFSVANGQFGTYNGVNGITGGSPVANVWYHLALVRKDSVTKMYIDGVQIGSSLPDTVNYQASTLNLGKNAFVTANLAGYIDEFRVVKGEAIYTVPFTPPNGPFQNRSDVYTASLMHFDGANGATITTDDTGKAVTMGSACALVTSKTKFGSASISFVDNTSSFAKIPMQAIGQRDFTIEFFANFNGVHGLEGANCMLDARPANLNGNYPSIQYSSASSTWIYNVNNSNKITGGPAVTTGVWYHVAVVRRNNVTRMYIDGVQIGADYADFTDYPSCIYTLGHNSFLTAGFIGNIDEFRVRIGDAAYTGNFTPPVAAFSLS